MFALLGGVLGGGKAEHLTEDLSPWQSVSLIAALGLVGVKVCLWY